MFIFVLICVSLLVLSLYNSFLITTTTISSSSGVPLIQFPVFLEPHRHTVPLLTVTRPYQLKSVPETQFTVSDWPWTSISSTTTRDEPTRTASVQSQSSPPPLIHIVHTRFMQEQSHLLALGRARLALFRTVCLPTMRQQSTTEFLWIVRTDPNLPVAFLAQLQQWLAPYPHMFLVASNINFRINAHFPGAWRGGAQARDLRQSLIYTGNQTLLELALQLQDRMTVLETRLDADDGLELDALATIQERARRTFFSSSSNDAASSSRTSHFEPSMVKWMYWCTRRDLEWHWTMPVEELSMAKGIGDPPLKALEAVSPQEMDPEKFNQNDQNNNQALLSFGILNAVLQPKLCVTPGLTVGFAVGTAEAEVPIYAHDQLVIKMGQMPIDQACGLPMAADCLQFLDDPYHHADRVHDQQPAASSSLSLLFTGIRSRTPTSAGMLHVRSPDEETLLQSNQGWYRQFALWELAQSKFGLDRMALEWMNAYISQHLLEIAQDNLRGQCTSGHSCKVR